MEDPKLSALNSLLSGALSRHGLGQRITSVQLVTAANELLDKYLSAEQRPEARVVSFVQGELRLSCLNPSCRHALEGLSGTLARDLEARFPEQTVRRVTVYLDQGPVSEEEWYTKGGL